MKISGYEVEFKYNQPKKRDTGKNNSGDVTICMFKQDRKHGYTSQKQFWNRIATDMIDKFTDVYEIHAHNMYSKEMQNFIDTYINGCQNYVGTATVNPSDTYDKDEGERVAFRRLLEKIKRFKKAIAIKAIEMHDKSRNDIVTLLDKV